MQWTVSTQMSTTRYEADGITTDHGVLTLWKITGKPRTLDEPVEQHRQVVIAFAPRYWLSCTPSLKVENADGD